MHALEMSAPTRPPREPSPLAAAVVARRHRNQRHRLLQRIRRRYTTATAMVSLGPIAFNFTRIANPDTVLDEVAAEEDRRDRLAGKLGSPRREPQHLPYWAEVWDSAAGLGTLMATRLGDLRGVSVLDLGCGQGLSGCAAAALGASVMFADLESPSLLFARLNSLDALSPSPGTPGERRGEGDLTRRELCYAENHPHPNPLPEYRERGPKQLIRTRQLNWQTDRLRERFDLIVGADILYERAQWPHLEPFWRAHLANGGRILLGEPGRPSGDQFMPWITARGWSLDVHEQPVPTRAAPIRIFQLRLL